MLKKITGMITISVLCVGLARARIRRGSHFFMTQGAAEVDRRHRARHDAKKSLGLLTTEAKAEARTRPKANAKMELNFEIK